MAYTIRTDIPVPKKLSNFGPGPRRKGSTKYPLAELHIGASFLVPVENDPKKTVNNLSRITRLYKKANDVTDRDFLVRQLINDDGSFVLDEQGRKQVGVFAVQPKDL